MSFSQPTPEKATFGRLSLYGLALLVLFAALSFLAPMFLGVTGEGSLGFAVYGFALPCYGCIPNLFLALAGLIRRETPIWPAGVGFALSLLPALLAASWMRGCLSS